MRAARNEVSRLTVSTAHSRCSGLPFFAIRSKTTGGTMQ
jgi:hypothetical protein